MNIIKAIMQSCGYNFQEANVFLRYEVEELQRLADAGELCEDDFKLSCSNLGLDSDQEPHFIKSISRMII